MRVHILLVSSWARYLVKPLSLTLSPRRLRNSSSAGPVDSLLYISSSLLWPAMQYIIPTFRWKLSYGQNRQFCNEKERQLCQSFLRVTILTFLAILMTFAHFCSDCDAIYQVNMLTFKGCFGTASRSINIFFSSHVCLYR